MSEQKLDDSRNFWARVAVATAFVAMMVGSLNEYLEAIHEPAAQHPALTTQKKMTKPTSPGQNFIAPDQKRVQNEVHKTDALYLNPSKPAVLQHAPYPHPAAVRKTLAQKTV